MSQALEPSPIAIVGLFSLPIGVELFGDSQAYRTLAAEIGSDPPPLGRILTLVQPETSYPYPGILKKIHITVAEGDLGLHRIDDILLIIGDPSSLETLASNMIFFAEQIEGPYIEGAHLHIEYFPGHPYIKTSSEPLILGDPWTGKIFNWPAPDTDEPI
jgi:hypothetical protein